MKKLLISVIYVLSTLTSSCQEDNEVLKLYSQITELVGNPNATNDDYKKAILLSEEAIKLDKNYVPVYLAKVTAECKIRDYKNVMITLNDILKIKSEYAEVFAIRGFIKEKLGDQKGAQEDYSNAINMHERRIASRLGSLDDEINVAFMYVFTDSKELALREIEDLKVKHPNNEQLLFMEENIKEIDRDTFIKEYCP